MKYIIVRIHNSSLAYAQEVSSVEEGKSVIQEQFLDHIGRVMNYDELDTLDNMMEVYNDDDHDNTYTFSIGIL